MVKLRKLAGQLVPELFAGSIRPGAALQGRRVKLALYALDGALVTTLADETMAEGFKEFEWDGRDARGNPMSSGVYFYRLVSGGTVYSKKMLYLK